MNAIAATVRHRISASVQVLDQNAAVRQQQHERAAREQQRLHAAQALGQLLSSGDYARAWPILEESSGNDLTGLPPPLWDGQNSQGSLAITSGHGLGDQILFARFVRFIKTRGTYRVVMLAPKSLARLFRCIEGVDDVFPIPRVSGGHVNVELPWRTNWVAQLESLPRIFRCADPQSVPREAPYISADPRDIAHWRSRLPQTDGLRVGLVWRGDPNDASDAWRSLPSLAMLAPLFEVPGVTFISLQKGSGEDEAALAASAALRVSGAAPPFVHLGTELSDFADTAAILSQLDLLISVDTSVANLGGAMGVPTWVLARKVQEFRWLHGWYPTARLFQQRTFGDWRDPAEEAAVALAELVASRV